MDEVDKQGKAEPAYENKRRGLNEFASENQDLEKLQDLERLNGFDQDSARGDRTTEQTPEKPPTVLTYSQVYGCPACGSGTLSAMSMMDLFACDFCRHMFTANLQTQSVQLADSLQPMAWHWTGHGWRAAHQKETAATLVWAFAIGIVVLPVMLISLANYIFPPSNGLKFVFLWVGLTGISHSLISGWLLAEYHRWPWYVASRIRLQRWQEQWAS